MEEKTLIDALKKIPLFHSATADELDGIVRKIVVKTYKKNEIILYEEDTNALMYIILSGKVKVVTFNEEGKEIILTMHQTGDFFGEISLIDGKTAPGRVISTKETTAALISKKVFFSILFSHHKVLESLLTIFCSRFRESWEKIQMLNFRNAYQRIKMLFMMLRLSYGKETDDGILIDIRLTHQEIADMSGLTRETVTRIMDRLQEDEEIAILKDRAVLLKQRFFEEYS